jgi:hypothetical protein
MGSISKKREKARGRRRDEMRINKLGNVLL